MSSEQEAILRFGIEIEKMLCEKLGKQWRPSGMSIESLVEEMSAKANAPSAYVHLPKDPDRFIALHPGDRLTIEARNPDPAVVKQGQVLQQLLTLLGPTAPACCGCAEEWQAAIDLIKRELE